MTDWWVEQTRRQNRESFRHQPAEPKQKRRYRRHRFTAEQLAVADRWAATQLEKKRENHG